VFNATRAAVRAAVGDQFQYISPSEARDELNGQALKIGEISVWSHYAAHAQKHTETF
jgi:hypothetical protein